MEFEQLIRERYSVRSYKPEAFEPLAILLLGYPAEDASPKHYHEEYRPMDEVVFYEKF